MQQKIFIASEMDGLDVINLVMVMEVDEERIKSPCDFAQAVRNACKEYCLTDEGRRVYEGNCNCFNWGDFDTYVPNAICEKYGIRKTLTTVSEQFYFDEQLVDEEDIFPEE